MVVKLLAFKGTWLCLGSPYSAWVIVKKITFPLLICVVWDIKEQWAYGRVYSFSVVANWTPQMLSRGLYRFGLVSFPFSCVLNHQPLPIEIYYWIYFISYFFPFSVKTVWYHRYYWPGRQSSWCITQINKKTMTVDSYLPLLHCSFLGLLSLISLFPTGYFPTHRSQVVDYDEPRPQSLRKKRKKRKSWSQGFGKWRSSRTPFSGVQNPSPVVMPFPWRTF